MHGAESRAGRRDGCDDRVGSGWEVGGVPVEVDVVAVQAPAQGADGADQFFGTERARGMDQRPEVVGYALAHPGKAAQAMALRDAERQERLSRHTVALARAPARGSVCVLEHEDGGLPGMGGADGRVPGFLPGIVLEGVGVRDVLQGFPGRASGGEIAEQGVGHRGIGHCGFCAQRGLQR